MVVGKDRRRSCPAPLLSMDCMVIFTRREIRSAKSGSGSSRPMNRCRLKGSVVVSFIASIVVQAATNPFSASRRRA